MSYILDALRKADAQRENDPARGIHAQPAALTPAAATNRRGLAWLAGGAVLLALAGAAAAFLWPRASVPRPPAVVLAPAAVTPPQEEAAPAGAAAGAPPAPVVADAIVPAAPPMPKPVAAPAPSRPARVVAAAPAPAAAAPAAAPLVAAAPVPLLEPAPLKEPAAAAAARILAFSELPPDVQREAPKLKISGGVHSDNAAQRMLIVGGELLKEGAQVAPGVVLEQIRPRSAVLAFRGYRYSVSY